MLRGRAGERSTASVGTSRGAGASARLAALLTLLAVSLAAAGAASARQFAGAGADEFPPPARRYALGLSGDRAVELRGVRDIVVELEVDSGVQRVPARVDSVWSTAGGAVLEVEISPPLDPGAEAWVLGVLVRADRARAGAWIGGAAGTALGYLAAALWLDDESDLRGRILRVAAVAGGGALGGLAGRRAGAAFGETRGIPASWMRSVE